MICADDGGVLDDLVVYRLDEDEFLVVANASNTAVVFGGALRRAAGFDARVTDPTGDYALIAIQGPAAAGDPRPADRRPGPRRDQVLRRAFGEVAGRQAWVARTGYTGEDGFEVFCRPDDAEPIWDALAAARQPGPAWSRRAWPPAIRSGSRPACRCTATSSART